MNTSKKGKFIMKTNESPSNSISIKRIEGVDCYESNGVAYLSLEAAARGLGFTTVATSGNDAIRWTRVRKYLEDLKAIPKGADLPEYIPENIFYRLAMKAKNPVAEAFQAKVADEIIPAIRKTGKYEVQPEVSSAVEISGPYLRQLREKKGLTIADVSRATGVDYSNLAGFERGKDKKFCVGKAKRVLVYNYLISLPDAIIPLPTNPGLRYVTTVRTDPVQRRDYPVEPAPELSVPTSPISPDELSEMITKAVTKALSNALCDAMVILLRDVKSRGLEQNCSGFPTKFVLK